MLNKLVTWQAWHEEQNMRTGGTDFVVDLLEMDEKSLDLYLSHFVVEIKNLTGNHIQQTHCIILFVDNFGT